MPLGGGGSLARRYPRPETVQSHSFPNTGKGIFLVAIRRARGKVNGSAGHVSRAHLTPWDMLAVCMNSERRKSGPDEASATPSDDIEKLREAAASHARSMGLPPAAARRVVAPSPSGTPAPPTGDARGAHPGVMEILLQAGHNAIRDTEPDTLRRKRIPEQLHAISKEDLYRHFEVAIRDIWPAIEQWQAREDALLGRLETVHVRDSAGRMREGQTLKPLDESTLAGIAREPSFRRTVSHVAYYVRAVWRAHISLWSERCRAAGQLPAVPEHFQMAAGKQQFDQFLWSGVNTAVKMMTNSLVLLHELQVERNGTPVIPAKRWQEMVEGNRSFVSLFAALGLNDFVAFDAMVEEPRDPEHVEFLQRAGLRNYSRKGDLTHLYPPFYQRRFFRLVDDTKGVPRLDLDPQAFTPDLRAAFGRDIMIRRCPALRVGVINQVYGWIGRAVTELAGPTLD